MEKTPFECLEEICNRCNKKYDLFEGDACYSCPEKEQILKALVEAEKINGEN